MSLTSEKKKRKKKGKYRKNSQYEAQLKKDDLEFLTLKTKYTSDEIIEWHSGFIDDNPDGLLTKVKMLDMYSQVLSAAKANMFVDQIFSKYDTDNDGHIDFKEFMLATNTSESETAEEKLRWAFKVYDKDSSGTIDCKELMDIVGNMYESQGFSKDTANERSEAVFKMLDKDHDGELDEEEFVAGCLRDERLRSLLNSGDGDWKK